MTYKYKCDICNRLCASDCYDVEGDSVCESCFDDMTSDGDIEDNGFEYCYKDPYEEHRFGKFEYGL